MVTSKVALTIEVPRLRTSVTTSLFEKRTSGVVNRGSHQTSDSFELHTQTRGKRSHCGRCRIDGSRGWFSWTGLLEMRGVGFAHKMAERYARSKGADIFVLILVPDREREAIGRASEDGSEDVERDGEFLVIDRGVGGELPVLPLRVEFLYDVTGVIAELLEGVGRDDGPGTGGSVGTAEEVLVGVDAGECRVVDATRNDDGRHRKCIMRRMSKSTKRGELERVLGQGVYRSIYTVGENRGGRDVFGSYRS